MAYNHSLADGIAQQLKCSVCLDEFKRPKLLRCYHSFCEECVQGLLKKAQDNIVKCPQCRTEMKVPNGNVKSLKSNFFLNNILEIMDKNRRRRERSEMMRSSPKLSHNPCTCDKETIAKCRTCNVDMCESCIDSHLKNPKTKKHEFIRQNDVVLCEQHLFEEKRFFCEQCEELYCEKCLKLNHMGHKSIEFKNIIKTQKKAIDWLLVRCQAKIPTLNWELARFKVMNEMTEKNAEETKKEIDEHFDKLITALGEKRFELKNQVETVKHEKLKQIFYEQENVIMAIERLHSGIEFTEQATKAGNEKEFLSMRKQIFARLEELSASEVPKSTFNGRWDIYLRTPYKANLPLLSTPLVNGFRIQSDTVKSDLKMVGGEDGLMYTTFMNQRRNFVITLKDENGVKISMGGQHVHVAIRVPSEAASSDEKTLNYVDIDVTDNNDGTHSFTYEPKIQGVYFLRITINGRSLTDDFEWTVEAPLGFGERANKHGSIQLYPPNGTAPTWNRFVGEKYSWKIRRVSYEKYTIIRVGVMMDTTSNKWGWSNGRREEPRENSTGEKDAPLCTIPSWLEKEELTFYSNEETGRFIIYHEASGESEVFKRCPGTATRPFVYPASYDIFSMGSCKLKMKNREKSIEHAQQISEKDKLPGRSEVLEKVKRLEGTHQDSQEDKLPAQQDKLPTGQELEEDKLPEGQDSVEDKLPTGQDSEEDKLPTGQDSEEDKLPTPQHSEEDKLPTGQDSQEEKLSTPQQSEEDKLPTGQDSQEDTLPTQQGSEVVLDKVLTQKLFSTLSKQQ